jgi:hypothetical protein
MILDFELSRGETGVEALGCLRALGCGAPCLFWTGAPAALRRQLDRSGPPERPPIAEKGTSITSIVSWVQRLLDSHVAESNVKGTVRRQSGVRRRVASSEKEPEPRS